jgi:hypothetical protein
MSRFNAIAFAMKWPLFVTLTKPNSETVECVREIRADWAKMRRRKIMEKRVRGGVTTIEITNHGNGWHPHLHILCDCEWLSIHTPPPRGHDSAAVFKQKCEHAQMELSAVWANVIKSPIAVVWVERKKPGDCLAYAMKYAVKGSDLIECREKIGPLIDVISKSRMVSAFGDWHGRIAPDDEDEKPGCCCTNCGAEKSWIPESIVDSLYRRSYDATHAIR